MDKELELQAQYEIAWLEGEIKAILNEFGLPNLWLENPINTAESITPINQESVTSDLEFGNLEDQTVTRFS